MINFTQELSGPRIQDVRRRLTRFPFRTKKEVSSDPSDIMKLKIQKQQSKLRYMLQEEDMLQIKLIKTLKYSPEVEVQIHNQQI